jgi:hypothetical protein
MLKLSKVGDLKSSDFNVVRVHASNVAKLGGRYAWVSISNESGKTIYRIIKGIAARGVDSKCLLLDYDSKVALGIGYKQTEVLLTVKKATFIESVVGHYQTPDPSYRVPFILSLIGLILGVMSFLQPFLFG